MSSKPTIHISVPSKAPGNPSITWRAFEIVYPESVKNLFDHFQIPPSNDPKAITEAFRKRIAKASSEEEKSELRAAWQKLTKHPEDTAFLAAFAYIPSPKLKRPKRTFQPTKAAKILHPIEEALTGNPSKTNLFSVTDHPDDPIFK